MERYRERGREKEGEGMERHTEKCREKGRETRTERYKEKSREREGDSNTRRETGRGELELELENSILQGL